ncbi:lysylphosphatidylglycerol synthase transmembrane domain-containing protein [Thermococcus zilligii]|uniref:lysylphosphatidylglycerol synthase transmembrane domain-containing protein n=1 Tax=Thermococcus zilligii TaxID=54076 RepID=UPI00029A1392|nr:lysylphosphatidylglycerol synthase transmembrane domain-containing protein [Thermococcus zilligii]
MEWKKALPFLAGLAVILALVWWAGTEEVLTILSGASLTWLGAALLAYLGGIITWALRWHVLLEGVGVKARFRDTLAALFVGILFNNITPGARGGGEAIRAYYLAGRTGPSYGRILASITADRILDLIPVMVMMLFSMFYAYWRGVYSLFTLLLLLNVIIISLTGLATVIIASESRMRKILFGLFRLLARIMPSRVLKYEEKFGQLVETNIPHFANGLRTISRDRKTFTVALGYSFLTWFFVLLRSYFIFISLSHRVSFTDVMVVQMIGTAVGLISIIPGGAGLIEAVTAGSFVLLGITREMAVTASILDRIISFWLPLVAGIIFVAKFGLKPKTASLGGEDTSDKSRGKNG